MKRPDLGAGCDGWQVVDPTPQEKSEGTCRPLLQIAVKMMLFIDCIDFFLLF